MARVVLPVILWIGILIGLSASKELINCLDGAKCDTVRAIVQGSQDVGEVIRKHSMSKAVDFHGNLLTDFLGGYSRPAVQWERLNLSYNLLEFDVFQTLQSHQLKYVDITYNQLTSVTILPSVLEFIAECNKLSSISIQSRNLQRLILPKNKFDSLGQFKNLPSLTELDLSCNLLENVNLNDLTLPNLQSLNLASNHIHIIQGTNPMRSLQDLDISSNILTSVDESFNNFPNIKHLYLQNNKIIRWMNTNIDRSLQSINIENNDWDCYSLNAIKPKIVYKIIRGTDASKCTTVDLAFVDRLIQYRKKEFKVLQEGTARLEGNISCDSYKPSPCDGDDNRVYEVAGLAARDAGNIAKKNVAQLESMLLHEENLLKNIEDQIKAANRENSQLSSVNQDLTSYINDQYQLMGLSGDNDPLSQLNKIFEKYEYTNTELKREINAEEISNQDKLNEINTIKNEIDDETYTKEKLSEEIDRRNQTVIGYQKRIDELQRQLG